MTRARILAKAVAFDAAPATRHYQGLTQSELEEFWTMVDALKHGARSSDLMRGVQVPPRSFTVTSAPPHVLSPLEADRLKRGFDADQNAIGIPLSEVLP